MKLLLSYLRLIEGMWLVPMFRNDWFPVMDSSRKSLNLFPWWKIDKLFLICMFFNFLFSFFYFIKCFSKRLFFLLISSIFCYKSFCSYNSFSFCIFRIHLFLSYSCYFLICIASSSWIKSVNSLFFSFYRLISDSESLLTFTISSSLLSFN